jgi:hypothetical protein
MEELDAYERRFRRAGLPLLIDGWSAREDALPRAFPLLAFVFLGELLGALNLTWSPLANLGALAAALGLLLGAVALTNKVRGRPATTLPRDLGPLELTIFVVVPALLPLLFGGQVTSALVTAGANLVLVALAAFGFGFGACSRSSPGRCDVWSGSSRSRSCCSRGPCRCCCSSPSCSS